MAAKKKKKERARSNKLYNEKRKIGPFLLKIIKWL